MKQVLPKFLKPTKPFKESSVNIKSGSNNTTYSSSFHKSMG
jgi:hypothetical protein